MNNSEILFNELPGARGNIGEIILNRPHALNTLTTDMCRQLREHLIQWQQDDNIKAVIIRGEGDKAFCAGGDVKTLYNNADNKTAVMEFFRQEYSMNRVIFHFTKPYIAFLDGITMGGGAGISVPGSHRVATEKFSFAMPETLIGFFPDVGAGYFLNKCPGKTGYYLGLTGATIRATDALALNLINHVIAQKYISEAIKTLCDTPFGPRDFSIVTDIISSFRISVHEPDILLNQMLIEECFAFKEMEAIIYALQAANTSWSLKTRENLLKRSPTSLKVTLAHLYQAIPLSFDEVMQQEFNMAVAFMHSQDFYEGVRAVLVDKDQKPTWQPGQLSEVSEETVKKFFIQVECGLEI